MDKQYTLLGPDGKFYQSEEKGAYGGNRGTRIYGKLTCGTAISAYKRWGAENRVFFATEEDAIAAGYRPCGHCMREKYLAWKAEHGQ